MIETITKHKNYQIHIIENDNLNLKELIIGEELGNNHFYNTFNLDISNEEIIKQAKRIIENSK
jgi:hypothetical protein